MAKDYKAEYAAKLRDPRWKAKRAEILARDGGLCCQCWPLGAWGCDDGDDDSHSLEFLRHEYGEDWYREQLNVQVHHKVYHFGREPWEYEDKDLITLCAGCHEDVHYRMWVDKIRSLDAKYNLPELKEGLYTAKECVDHFYECLNHPNWEAYNIELEKVKAARARFYGMEPEDWID